MRYAVSALFIATGLAGFGHAGENASDKLKVETEWSVSIDAQGHVIQLEDRRELKPALREPLERAIRGWTFEAGRINGQPAPTETSLSLSVTLESRADGRYAVHVDDARTGGRIAKSTPPKFPRSAAHAGFRAMVVMKASYDQDGKVMAVALEQGAPSASRDVNDAAIAAVKHWTFHPEIVGGHGIAASAVLPICFFVVTTWPKATDKAPCNWTPPDARSSIGDGQAFALAPVAKLQTDVIGRTL